MSETTRLRSGLLVFPNMTQLDLTGPYEVLARLPGAETLLLWKNLDPVRSEHGLMILPMATLESSAPLDLILVPGGAGINPLLEDAEVLAYLRRAAAEARYVVGVCTGSLVLGAAGLLRGRRATTHRMSRDLLRSFGAEPVAQRVVVDGKFFTGGGVTAGHRRGADRRRRDRRKNRGGSDPARHRIRPAAAVCIGFAGAGRPGGPRGRPRPRRTAPTRPRRAGRPRRRGSVTSFPEPPLQAARWPG